MPPLIGRPEWRAREVSARFAIGLAGGAVAIAATDPEWELITNAFGEARFLVDRLMFLLAASVVAAILCRMWYRTLPRATLFAGVLAASFTFSASEIPLALLKAIVKPLNPDLWMSLFGNPAMILAYAPIYGVPMGLVFIIAVPFCRAFIGPVVGDRPGWAIRPAR
jgi:hypothetical protein